MICLLLRIWRRFRGREGPRPGAGPHAATHTGVLARTDAREGPGPREARRPGRRLGHRRGRHGQDAAHRRDATPGRQIRHGRKGQRLPVGQPLGRHRLRRRRPLGHPLREPQGHQAPVTQNQPVRRPRGRLRQTVCHRGQLDREGKEKDRPRAPWHGAGGGVEPGCPCCGRHGLREVSAAKGPGASRMAAWRLYGRFGGLGSPKLGGRRHDVRYPALISTAGPGSARHSLPRWRRNRAERKPQG